jgi:hypothetical protein
MNSVRLIPLSSTPEAEIPTESLPRPIPSPRSIVKRQRTTIATTNESGRNPPRNQGRAGRLTVLFALPLDIWFEVWPSLLLWSHHRYSHGMSRLGPFSSASSRSVARLPSLPLLPSLLTFPKLSTYLGVCSTQHTRAS